ncbi:glycosyltransferase family 2 protein [Spirosoma oryzicola]|uniref:glycosyltransferase family 2 protein n=1 Tax=Spirosoma oryzicola TaxID=2898794 RepID=UPI001E49EC6E|nr:glycosyltransferase family 2 protein [Spirosoma oryzicola]UHG91718.1 glycosyltransferase family 2 protein [Spirosoma oryzicola]
MASYNGEAHIKNQLLSILPQLSTEDEIIISDDNSLDKTLYIVSQLKDDRIKIVYNISTPGPVGNFQNSLRHATGDYIILADQDDLWLDNKVKVIKELLNTHDLILSDCQVVNEKGQILHSSFFKYRNSRSGFWLNLYKNSYIGCCMAFRREVLAYALPIPTQVHMHDWWIGLLVEIKGKVCFYPQPLISYVRHGSNASPTGESSDYSLIQRLRNRFFLLLHVIRRLSSNFSS